MASFFGTGFIKNLLKTEDGLKRNSFHILGYNRFICTFIHCMCDIRRVIAKCNYDALDVDDFAAVNKKLARLCDCLPSYRLDIITFSLLDKHGMSYNCYVMSLMY